VLNLAAQLDSARQTGRYVTLLPAPGEPGPAVRDLRRNVRLVFIDTHWFLQQRSGQERNAFFERVEEVVSGAGNREVIVVAHHPYRSAGPHGAILPGYHAGGVAYLLRESGALVQDLNSPAYEDLLTGLRRAFIRAGKRPLVFAGGHDHSLQVLEGENDQDPRFALVSGAGSKLSSLQTVPGLTWGAAQPGYMMLVFRKDDGVDLFVVAGEANSLKCAGPETKLRSCMADAIRTFGIVYSAHLLAPPG
jgi:hypothetical protein